MMAATAHALYSLTVHAAAASVARWKQLRGEWSRESVAERYGRILPTATDTQPIWIHAASMGEVRVGATLARALAERGHQIIISSMTDTGYNLARSVFPPKTIAIRAPFDTRAAVERIIRHFSPTALVLVETELWPNLISVCAANDIMMFLVNGRLSDRAFPKYKWTRWYWRGILEGIARYYMRTPLDAERMALLGVDPNRIEVAGSLKSADAPLMSPSTRALLERLGRGDRPVWIAGSTRPGEEEIVLSAHAQLKRTVPDLQLWMAPRHPDRFDHVAAMIPKAGLSLARWSNSAEGSLRTSDVLLIDCMGVLPELYGCAHVAFVGGSLKPFGGHSPMEAALAGTPVIFGPHMETQRDSAAWLAEKGLAENVKDGPEIIAAVLRALNSDDSDNARDRRAACARTLSAGVVEHVATDILQRLGHSTSP